MAVSESRGWYTVLDGRVLAGPFATSLGALCWQGWLTKEELKRTTVLWKK